MDKLILHCDLNNFYASVETLLHPELKETPLAVSGNPEKRHGVILAKNELAKKFGIKTGDVIWEAKRKCPDLVLLPPHFDKYMEYSRRVFELYTRYTDRVEPFGADECWLDCTGSVKLFGDGLSIANSIRKTIREETGLTASVGVSFNKVFAKLGSDLQKPDATTVIDRENYKDRIYGLKASEMLGVGRQTAAKLAKLNIITIGQLAAADKEAIGKNFGIVGERLVECARGEYFEPVREAVLSRKIKSVGHGMTASRDIVTDEDARTLIGYLADLVATRMRRYCVRGSGIAVDLRYSDLTHETKQTKLATAVCTALEIRDAAFSLLKQIRKPKPLRTITISVFDLCDIGVQQLDFLSESHDKNEKLEQAIDKIREKYGNSKLTKADLIAGDFIYDKTDAEDFLPFQR